MKIFHSKSRDTFLYLLSAREKYNEYRYITWYRKNAKSGIFNVEAVSWVKNEMGKIIPVCFYRTNEFFLDSRDVLYTLPEYYYNIVSLWLLLYPNTSCADIVIIIVVQTSFSRWEPCAGFLLILIMYARGFEFENFWGREDFVIIYFVRFFFRSLVRLLAGAFRLQTLLSLWFFAIEASWSCRC